MSRCAGIMVVVDVQRDFMYAGALAAFDSESLIDPLNRAIESASGGGFQIVATRDWHPMEHESFRSRGGPWPIHCVARTPGADFHPKLRLPESTIIISKGTTNKGAGYSPFENEEMVRIVTQSPSPVTMYITGIALEYCVRATCLDTIKYGGYPIAIKPLVRSVASDPTVVSSVWEELGAAGVALLDEIPPELR